MLPNEPVPPVTNTVPDATDASFNAPSSHHSFLLDLRLAPRLTASSGFPPSRTLSAALTGLVLVAIARARQCLDHRCKHGGDLALHLLERIDILLERVYNVGFVVRARRDVFTAA